MHRVRSIALVAMAVAAPMTGVAPTARADDYSDAAYLPVGDWSGANADDPPVRQP